MSLTPVITKQWVIEHNPKYKKMFTVVKETKYVARGKWLYILCHHKMKDCYEELTITYEELL